MATCNVTIDLSHNNRNVDIDRVQADGIQGIIHKATQGTGFIDPTYGSRRAAAKDAGLLWGAYHFGTAANPVAQARFFLRVANPEPQDLIVLDFEVNEQNPSNTMSLDRRVRSSARYRILRARSRDCMGVLISKSSLAMLSILRCELVGCGGHSTVPGQSSRITGQRGHFGNIRTVTTVILLLLWTVLALAIATNIRERSMTSERNG